MPNTIADNLTRLQTARTAIATAITTKGGTVAEGAGLEDFPTAIGTIPSGGGSTLITKSITSNGTYNASSDDADGYSSVTVTVPNTYTAGDEGKVVSSGALVAQTARPDTITVNGSYITTNYNSVTVNVQAQTPTPLGTTSTTPSLTPGGKSWANNTNVDVGEYVWTDGIKVYRSNSVEQKVFNRGTRQWNNHTWTASGSTTTPNGKYIWSDGTNIYYSQGSAQHVLDVSTSTWSTKTWTGSNKPDGSHIWSDGTNIYSSNGVNQYVLDGNEWKAKTWTNAPTYGNCVWTDGTNLYYSDGTTQYVYNNGDWEAKTWTGLTDFYGYDVWTDGDEIYYSNGASTTGGSQYKLNTSTSTWTSFSWTGYIPNLNGSYVWTDGYNYYCSGVLSKPRGYSKL